MSVERLSLIVLLMHLLEFDPAIVFVVACALFTWVVLGF